jgi:hypothetical protein
MIYFKLHLVSSTGILGEPHFLGFCITSSGIRNSDGNAADLALEIVILEENPCLRKMSRAVEVV